MGKLALLFIASIAASICGCWDKTPAKKPQVQVIADAPIQPNNPKPPLIEKKPDSAKANASIEIKLPALKQGDHIKVVYADSGENKFTFSDAGIVKMEATNKKASFEWIDEILGVDGSKILKVKRCYIKKEEFVDGVLVLSPLVGQFILVDLSGPQPAYAFANGDAIPVEERNDLEKEFPAQNLDIFMNGFSGKVGEGIPVGKQFLKAFDNVGVFVEKEIVAAATIKELNAENARNGLFQVSVKAPIKNLKGNAARDGSVLTLDMERTGWLDGSSPNSSVKSTWSLNYFPDVPDGLRFESRLLISQTMDTEVLSKDKIDAFKKSIINRTQLQMEIDEVTLLYNRGEKTVGFIARVGKERIGSWQQGDKDGIPEAQLLLGLCYVYGVGVDRNDKMAIECYRKAANGKLPLAMNNLGVRYLNGQGVELNLDTAKDYLNEAAELGLAVSQVNLANVYLRENENSKQALHWMRKAAGLGHPVAQTYLAFCYREGKGMNPNRDLRNFWIRRAAAQGYEPAKQLMRESGIK